MRFDRRLHSGWTLSIRQRCWNLRLFPAILKSSAYIESQSICASSLRFSAVQYNRTTIPHLASNSPYDLMSMKRQISPITLRWQISECILYPEKRNKIAVLLVSLMRYLGNFIFQTRRRPDLAHLDECTVRRVYPTLGVVVFVIFGRNSDLWDASRDRRVVFLRRRWHIPGPIGWQKAPLRQHVSPSYRMDLLFWCTRQQSSLISLSLTSFTMLDNARSIIKTESKPL